MNIASSVRSLRKSLIPVALITLSSLTQVPTALAMDALQVLPTRIVMASQRSSELTLVNKGTEEGNYRIILRNIRTDDNGKFTIAEKTEDGELFANKLIRFSPRRVSIEGGSYQKVRVMVRKPKSLPDGEYRTHMVFQSLPKQDNNSLDDTGELSVSVDPIVEVSIPIIIRHGKLKAAAKIESPTIEDSRMAFTLLREGTRSIYGDIEVLFKSGPHKGDRAGYIRGLSVYYPNPKRILRIPLQLPEDYDKGRDAFSINFTEDPTYGGDQSTSIDFKP